MTKPCTIALFLSCVATGLAHAQPQLQSDTPLATAGYFRLTWQAQQPGAFELQQARLRNFTNAQRIYEGQDTATVISGLADGHYYFRVRQDNGSVWSKPVEVEVKHHPLSRAFGFFTLGAIMFVITVAVLLKGNWSRRQS